MEWKPVRTAKCTAVKSSTSQTLCGRQPAGTRLRILIASASSKISFRRNAPYLMNSPAIMLPCKLHGSHFVRNPAVQVNQMFKAYLSAGRQGAIFYRRRVYASTTSQGALSPKIFVLFLVLPGRKSISGTIRRTCCGWRLVTPSRPKNHCLKCVRKL